MCSARSSTAPTARNFARKSRTLKAQLGTKCGAAIVSLRSQIGRPKADLRVIDLGAGHSSANETLCGRVVSALKTEALLNESVGAGYLDRHWPPAFKDTGAWPLKGLRQSFLDGSLTRLTDPDAVLRRKIVEFVESRFLRLGLRYQRTAAGTNGCGSPNRSEARRWRFEASVFLLAKEKAQALREIVEEGRSQDRNRRRRLVGKPPRNLSPEPPWSRTPGARQRHFA